MKATMISILKPHANEILAGTKRIEWRTRPLPKGKTYIYEPIRYGGKGKVVGHMYIYENYRFESVTEIPEEYLKIGRASKFFLKKYSKNKPIYANLIINAERYSVPIPLSKFRSYNKCAPCVKPPQSYYYVEDIDER